MSVLTMIKTNVRSMMESARENSEKINHTATQQQRISVILHELSGTVSTDPKNFGSSSDSGGFGGKSPGFGSKSPGFGGKSLGLGDSVVLGGELSRPILHPLEGTYVLTPVFCFCILFLSAVSFCV